MAGIFSHQADITMRTSAFGTCIQKYVIERYVCVIVFMVIAQTHVQAVATVHLRVTPTMWT